jgi:hypothetical protein
MQCRMQSLRSEIILALYSLYNLTKVTIISLSLTTLTSSANLQSLIQLYYLQQVTDLSLFHVTKSNNEINFSHLFR